eukprot:g6468.t1
MDAVSLTVQELRQLRDKIDNQLRECLERLNGDPSLNECSSVLSANTPVQQESTKKRRYDSDPESSINQDLSNEMMISSIPDEIPCRVDLSSFAYLIREGLLEQTKEVESKVGKRLRPSYVYGNYPNYYSYRLNKESSDPRLECFKKKWFAGKRCLDLGSHIGVFPLSLVTEFSPLSMIGIEIDATLVNQSRIYCDQMKSQFRSSSKISKSLRNTEFINQDILDFLKQQTEDCYDVVTCLSVAKWIHFHHGDEGMCDLFRQLWKILAPNGRLIFEPQSAKSYTQTIRKQDMSTVPYHPSAMQFLPDQFLQYLTESVGFSLEHEISAQESNKGFNRPIYVLRKQVTGM